MFAALALGAIGAVAVSPSVAMAQPAADPAAAVDPAVRADAIRQIRERIQNSGQTRNANGSETATSKPVQSDIKSTTTIHSDRTSSNSPAMALLFWIFAAACVGGALFVITRANLVTAVMGMVGTFLAIAAVYMMLFASFLAVIQVMVYAGAIMVLFVFVIMILNRPEDEPFARSGKVGKGLAALAMAYILLRLASALWKVTPINPEVAANAPSPVNIGTALKPELVDWGSTKALGASLFTDYLFLFEAVSILLLIAVVGAIAVARPLDPDIESPGDMPNAFPDDEIPGTTVVAADGTIVPSSSPSSSKAHA